MASPAAPLPTLDTAAVDALVEAVGREAAVLLADELVEEVARLSAAIAHAAADGDAALLSGAAHELKGVAANFGLAALAALCRDIEQTALGEGQAAVLLAALPGEIEAGTAALRARITG